MEELRAAGVASGLDTVGVASAEPFTNTQHDLEERRAAGLSATMQFTYRNPARSTDPSVTLPGVASLVVGALRYHRADPPRNAPASDDRSGPGEEPMGRVARYARQDHYARLRSGLEAVAQRLGADGWATRVVADSNALVDREAARRAGLGWYGKSSNLLLEGQGSWFVLGSVLTDAPLPAAGEPVADGCGSCRRCLDACPTGAIVAPGVVDARRCLAWVVQAEGAIPRELRVPLGDRLYGCDDCQEVCPPNHRAARAVDGDLPAVPADGHDEPGVPLLDLLAAGDDELMARHGRWYIPRRDPRYLRRNALVALGNTGDPADARVAAAVAAHLCHRDPLVRAHAVWAARRLGRFDLLGHQITTDPAAEVRQELAAVPPPVVGAVTTP